MITFRESVQRIFRTGTAESSTRVMCFLMVLSIIGWEWWAVIHKTEVPGLVELLAWVAVAMGWKQYNERKAGEMPPPPGAPQ